MNRHIFSIMLFGFCLHATAQNTIIYLIPDPAGSDNQEIAVNNSLDYAYNLAIQSTNSLLVVEGHEKQYSAINASEASIVMDSIRSSVDLVLLSKDTSILGFHRALDRFEANTGLSLIDQKHPNIELHVVIAGNLENVIHENVWVQSWFEPIFRQNGWESQNADDKQTWPDWLIIKHLFDENSLGEIIQLK